MIDSILITNLKLFLFYFCSGELSWVVDISVEVAGQQIQQSILPPVVPSDINALLPMPSSSSLRWQVASADQMDYVDLSVTFTSIFTSPIIEEDESAITEILEQLYSTLCKLH